MIRTRRMSICTNVNYHLCQRGLARRAADPVSNRLEHGRGAWRWLGARAFGGEPGWVRDNNTAGTNGSRRVIDNSADRSTTPRKLKCGPLLLHFELVRILGGPQAEALEAGWKARALKRQRN